jgi:hypothetical protein
MEGIRILIIGKLKKIAKKILKILKTENPDPALTCEPYTKVVILSDSYYFF